VRRWYPIVLMVVGALITVYTLAFAPRLLPVGLVVMIAGAATVRAVRRPRERRGDHPDGADGRDLDARAD
jgi:hypothetical protein